MEPAFKIAICGGGNLAHGCSAVIGHRNKHFQINVLSRRPYLWNSTITAYTKGSSWEKYGTLTGNLNCVSDDPAPVVDKADIIIICSPAHTKGEILRKIAPYVKKGALVGSVFGQGAFDLQATSILGDDLIRKKNITIFSFQYVPFICSVVNYGKDVRIIGPKKMLYAAAYPVENVHYVCNALTQAFFMPCVPIPSFLNLTLCPGNQIIHSGRVTGFFERFPEQCCKVFKKKDVPLLYEHLDQRSADEIQALDDEIQAIKKAIIRAYPAVNLDQVMPIRDRICTMYDGQVGNPTNLKTVFNTNNGYKHVPFPMLPVEGQDLKKIPSGEELVKLNLKARFFLEDIPYGLVILKDIGNIVDVDTPVITRNIIFHQKFMPVKYVNETTGELIDKVVLEQTGAPSAYGIKTIDQLLRTSMVVKPQMDWNINVFCSNRSRL